MAWPIRAVVWYYGHIIIMFGNVGSRRQVLASECLEGGIVESRFGCSVGQNGIKIVDISC